MKTIALFGGTGGLGIQLNQIFDVCSRFKVISIGSKTIDIKDYSQCDRFFSKNEIDIVINLAGFNYDSFIHKIDRPDIISHCLDVNLMGAINIAATCLPGMRQRGYGRLIYATSVLSTKVINGTGVYASCKAFIDRLVQNISNENISKGITANSIQLGYFDGGLTYRLPDVVEARNSLPLKRFGTVNELYHLIELLISNEYLTGANIQLNGGVI